MQLDKKASLTGTVLEIQRMSTEDGPGLRTTVFMKGCPMKCLWCHNPESISSVPQIHWIKARCIGCLTCIAACDEGNLEMTDDGLVINRKDCDGCGKCAEECPSTALELLGKKWEVHDLANELLKDREYFKQSGGGVTISGGEATLQWKFVSELIRILKAENVHICIDTCGIANHEALDAVLPNTDMVLFDLKEMDSGLHHQFTHNDLTQVLGSLSYIVDFIKANRTGARIWIRTPLIPGATAREENIRSIGQEISKRCNGTVTRWDLLAFNNLCKDKYQRLGIEWRFKDSQLIPVELMEKFAEVARQSGVDPAIVQWSGSTRVGASEKEAFGQSTQPKVCGC